MIVIDSDAIIAIASGKEQGKTLSLLKCSDEKIVAPTLIYAEAVHALTKYVQGGYFDEKKAMEIASNAFALIDEFVEDAELWKEALTQSLKLGHSSYDMYYLLLARREGATLFTLDRKLQKLCEESGVNTIVHTKL